MRGNAGGHTSQLIVEKLARRVIGWDVVRHRQPMTYPMDAPRGPIVTLADEFSGSDGDIVTAAIKRLGLGPVVGTRTWGGVIGIDGRYGLVDGTRVTQPRYAFWFDDLSLGRGEPRRRPGRRGGDHARRTGRRAATRSSSARSTWRWRRSRPAPRSPRPTRRPAPPAPARPCRPARDGGEAEARAPAPA